MRSMRTTRSKSASRSPPFSLILKRISPSRGIHSSSVFGSPSSMRRAHVGRLERIARADRMEHRHAWLRRRRHVAVEVLAFERGAEIVRQIAAHESRAVRFVAAHPEGLAVGVVDGGVEGAGHDQRAQLRDRHRQPAASRDSRRLRADTPARARGTRSIGMAPLVARRGQRRAGRPPARASRRARRPGGAAGKAHAFPSVIDPNPHASRPAPVRTRQSTFRSVTRSTDRPPN